MAIRAPFLYVGKHAGGGEHPTYTDTDLRRYQTPSEFVLVPGNSPCCFSTFNNSTGCTAVTSEINSLAQKIAALAVRVYNTPYSDPSVNHKYKVWIGTPFFNDSNVPIWDTSKEAGIRIAMNNIKNATLSYIDRVKQEINSISPASSTPPVSISSIMRSTMFSYSEPWDLFSRSSARS